MIKMIPLAILVFLTGVGIAASAYTLNEMDQALITQFGQPVGAAVTTPGLHFKLPLIQKIHRFDKRWLEWDGQADEMPTQEKTYIGVDAFARWRIVDPLQFYTSVRDVNGAKSRLDDIIDSETRNVIASHNLIEVVRSTNRPLQKIQIEGAEANNSLQPPSKIQVGRHKITRLILEKAQKAVASYGIELVDIQFQRVNYTDSVEKKVFERMISERKSIAAQYRSEGEGEAARIRGNKERELKTIESQAYFTVQGIEGEADAQASTIYADAYSLNPEFYRFTETLKSYKTTLTPKTQLILSTQSDYLSSLTHAR